MKKSAIGHEVAETEFNRFVDSMNLDVNLENMNDDDRQGFHKQHKIIIDSIRRKDATINDNGEPTFTPTRTENSSMITFHEPTGASFMAMDSKRTDAHMSKIFAVMADMTKTDIGYFSKMKNADLKVCIAFATLFLG